MSLHSKHRTWIGLWTLAVVLGAAGPAWAQALAPPPPAAVVSRNPYLPPPSGSGANPYAPRPYQPPGFSTGRNPYLPNPNATTLNPFPGIKQNRTPPSGIAAGSDAVPDGQASSAAAAVHPREVTIRGGNGELRRGSLGSVVFFNGVPYRLEGWSGDALLVRSERSRETIRLFPGDGNDGRGVYQFSTGPDRQPSFSNPLANPSQKEGPPKSSAPAYWNLNGRGGG